MKIETLGHLGRRLEPLVRQALERQAEARTSAVLSSRARISSLILSSRMGFDVAGAHWRHAFSGAAPAGEAILVVQFFERFVLVSPPLDASLCADCFERRMRCSPPGGLGVEDFAQLQIAHQALPDYEVEGVSDAILEIVAGMVAAVAEAVVPRRAILLDVAAIATTTAVILPIHGCDACDAQPDDGPSRFVRFASELSLTGLGGEYSA